MYYTATNFDLNWPENLPATTAYDDHHSPSADSATAPRQMLARLIAAVAIIAQGLSKVTDYYDCHPKDFKQAPNISYYCAAKSLVTHVTVASVIRDLARETFVGFTVESCLSSCFIAAI